MPLWLSGWFKPKQRLITIRQDPKNQRAAVFIHGFSGDIEKTWGQMPELLKNDPSLNDWDLFSVGFPSDLMFDLKGIWSADPDIATLADHLRTQAKIVPLSKYKFLALVAHSMGGLVVERAIVDSAEMAARLSHVFLFGTPSRGLSKAAIGADVKRQAKDMCEGSTFINDLRSRWDKAAGFGFQFVAVCGDKDEFVPRQTAIDGFPPENRYVVSGNHLQIVKPPDAKHEGFRLLLTILGGQTLADLQQNAGFDKTIQRLLPNRANLDHAATVELALALRNRSRANEACQVLNEAYERLKTAGQYDTDLAGTYAGHIKRMWLADRTDQLGAAALTIYSEAYEIAVRNQRPDQAYYLGVNVAFLLRAYRDDRQPARDMATKVLEHCAAAEKAAPTEDLIWRPATAGEANMMLGNHDQACACYQQAMNAKPSPWQRDSMYQQATVLAGLVGTADLAARLDKILRPA